jgi:hypothetical protein
MTVDDERLSAYLDDALSPSERAALERELAADSGARERLESLRRADALARRAFDAPLDEPLPERFRAVLEGRTADPTRAEVVALDPVRAAQQRGRASVGAGVPSGPSTRARRRWRQAPVALAAGLAGVAAFALGWLAAPGDAGREAAGFATTFVPGQPVFATLESTPSGARVMDGAVRPVLTFRAADGRYCREFEMARNGAGAVGVACRSAGGWELEALLRADVGASDTAGGYAPASGHAAAALDAVLDRLGAGTALGADEEDRARAAGWRAAP